MYLAAHILCLFKHMRGHWLLNQLHALRFQPVDFTDSFFLISPSLIGVHAQRFICYTADSRDRLFIVLESHLNLENRKVRRLARFLPSNLRRIDSY